VASNSGQATLAVTGAAAKPKAHLRELTSMRFVAAMAVLLGHFGPFFGVQSLTFDFAGGG